MSELLLALADDMRRMAADHDKVSDDKSMELAVRNAAQARAAETRYWYARVKSLAARTQPVAGEQEEAACELLSLRQATAAANTEPGSEARHKQEALIRACDIAARALRQMVTLREDEP